MLFGFNLLFSIGMSVVIIVKKRCKMEKLSLSYIFDVTEDRELAEYKVLGILRNYRDLFRQNKIYPYLSELIDIAYTFEDFMDTNPLYFERAAKDMVIVDIESEISGTEVLLVTETELEQIRDFMKWAIPCIENVINEGKAIYDFVEDNMELSRTEKYSNFSDNGYLIIPDNLSGKINIYKYRVPGEESGKTIIRKVETELLSSYEFADNPYKQILFKDSFDRNSIFINTDLSLPFQETILPVVQRLIAAKLNEVKN